MKIHKEYCLILDVEVLPPSFRMAAIQSNLLETETRARQEAIRQNYVWCRRQRKQTHVRWGGATIRSTDNPKCVVAQVPLHNRLTRSVASEHFLEQKLIPLVCTDTWQQFRSGTENSLRQQLLLPFRPTLSELSRDLQWILRYHRVGRSAPLCLKTAWKLPVSIEYNGTKLTLRPRIERYLLLVENAAATVIQQRWKKPRDDAC